ncbi:MAG TPA: DUF4129 domain-containing protein [Pyrinomonadaceae bacterium]|nr:DUF4129 domain-containing protein [Pyrinomonadaceae bacterium]
MRTQPHNLALKIATLAFIFLVVVLPVQAIPLNEYRDRVTRAVTALDSLAQTDEDESTYDYAQRNADTITAVRETLPASQTIEWGGTTFKVDNAWLHEELDRLSQSRLQEHIRGVARIKERLQAMSERLTEAESAAGAADKSAASRKLAEILQRREYAQKAKDQTFLRRLIERLMEWLQKLFPKPKPLSPGSAGIFSLIAQILVIALAVAVIGYVIRLLLPRLRKSGGRKKKEKKTARIVLGETLTPDQTANDLLAEAEALARRGELRAAIRKAYIALLVELGDRKVISLAQHKTNHDYLHAVRNNQPLYGNVKTLTDSFERHWYGLSHATESDWDTFRSGYQKALS